MKKWKPRNTRNTRIKNQRKLYGSVTAGPKNLYPVKSLLCEIFIAFNKRLIAGAKPVLRDQNTFNWG
jgi:hypothetical protein